MNRQMEEPRPTGIEKEQIEASEEEVYHARVREEAGLWELFVYLLNSLPTAIIAILILALLAAIGTLIPQESMGVTHADYVAKFGERKYHLLKSLGFTNIYNTVYFNIVFLWVAVSSIVCSVSRLRRTLRLWLRPTHGYSHRFFTARREPGRLYREGIPDSPEELQEQLKRAGFRTHLLRDADGSASIYADRGFIRKWASVVFHFAFILILVGGVIGRVFGFEGMVAVPDGGTSTVTVRLVDNKAPLVRWLVAGVHPFHYELNLRKFDIEYDQHLQPSEYLTGLAASEPALREYLRYYVKDYVSDLTVRSHGNERRKLVKVNHPLKIGGTSFYQTSYVQEGYLLVSCDGSEAAYPVRAGAAYQVWRDGRLHEISEFGPSPTGSEILYHPQTQGGTFPVKAGPLYRAGVREGELKPIGLFEILPADSTDSRYELLNTTDWLQLHLPGHKLRVRMASRVDSTSVFQYRHDPGVGVVFFGWIVLIIGIVLTMYVPFVQVHLRWEPEVLYCFSRAFGAADKFSGYRVIEKCLANR